MQPQAVLPGAAAFLEVIDPSGQKRLAPVDALPFQIGRGPDNHLVIRDSRVSRTHARILMENGAHILEDCGSRHGVRVNGHSITRHPLGDGDRIDFGLSDSFTLVFLLESSQFSRAWEHDRLAVGTEPAAGLARLRAILELERTVRGALTTADVLASVVDAAMAVTGAERGFLLLRTGNRLEMRVARGRDGSALPETDLRVPREWLNRALQTRCELFHMNFDPAGEDAGLRGTIADLELRSVVCVPLVRIRTGATGDTTEILAANDTVGILYLDSRLARANMAGANRELVQTLAIEASTVLENARLLEQERAKLRMDEEMALARDIQKSLLPRTLPTEGWLRACGGGVASHVVAGDYFDLAETADGSWSAVVADVSGKGVGAALLASLLQGALMSAASGPESLSALMERLNRFLIARTEREKYATLFYCIVARDGLVSYINAAHCPAILAGSRELEWLESTGTPVGLIDEAFFTVENVRLSPGDKLVIYTDGLTEGQNPAGEFFGRKRLAAAVTRHAGESCEAVYAAIQSAVAAFTEGAAQADDITLLVLEYASAPAV